MATDMEVLPDLVCGQTYRELASEMIAFSMRQRCDQRTDGGCRQPMAWFVAYRCRECGRWMHGPCLDDHFLESQHDTPTATDQEAE